MRTLLALLTATVLVVVPQAQSPLPGVDYPNHIFRTVVPVTGSAGVIRSAGFIAHPLREVYKTTEYTGYEYVGFYSEDPDTVLPAPSPTAPPDVFLAIGEKPLRQVEWGTAEDAWACPLAARVHWVKDWESGVVLRLWHTDYSKDDWETALLISNSDASQTLKDVHVKVVINGSFHEGIMPPNYGKAFRLGSRKPHEFVRSFSLEEGVGLLGGPSRHRTSANYDGSWLDQGLHFGFFHPIGVAYGGMTGGDGINQFPELFSNLEERVFTDQIRYHDRQRLEMEFERVPDYGQYDVFNFTFLRGHVGNFQYEEPSSYYVPKSTQDIRTFDPIGNQHAIRGMRYDLQLAWRCGDPLSCYWLERWGDWAELTFGDRQPVTGNVRSWGRAEAWALKAIASREAIEAARGEPVGSPGLANAIIGSALDSGLYQSLTTGKIATDPPYNGNFYCGRSQEQLFLALSLLEYWKVSGEDSYRESALDCLHGLLDVCWWSDSSSGFVDRYALGFANEKPQWTRRELDYPTLGLTIFHDSYDTGNLPALLFYAGDIPRAVETFGRVTGSFDIPQGLRNIAWDNRVPSNRAAQRLGRAPYSNFGLTYELAWGLQ